MGSLLKKKPSKRVDRSALKVGIPRFLNVWSTHQFWIAFFQSLGIDKIVFSSETSEEQYRTYGSKRITMDSCFPVKALAGHIGELLEKDINILFVPKIFSLPSFLSGHVMDSLSCTRVPMSVENIKAGFTREKNEFELKGVKFVSPFVPFTERDLLPKYLYDELKEAIDDLSIEEVKKAVEKGFESLEKFDNIMREKSLEILKLCVNRNIPAVLILARPYHLDSGIGHDIDQEIQSFGYPVLWYNYLPLHVEILNWLFKEDIDKGLIKSPFDISDVWTSSYSSNTNEIIWAAKFAGRFPHITCVIRLSSYECGMDQPTYTPVQKIVESRGTLFFKFGELDETKPTGSVKIRLETIDYYVRKYSQDIIQRKLRLLPKPIPSILKGL